mmetsp:Transcript_17589/g.37208  ORF Transcript_17589/g.37208 Transcript_17589/m.37208 type:complete len:201 (+) Transcript_17589:970-1572(+)
MRRSASTSAWRCLQASPSAGRAWSTSPSWWRCRREAPPPQSTASTACSRVWWRRCARRRWGCWPSERLGSSRRLHAATLRAQMAPLCLTEATARALPRPRPKTRTRMRLQPRSSRCSPSGGPSASLGTASCTSHMGQTCRPLALNQASQKWCRSGVLLMRIRHVLVQTFYKAAAASRLFEQALHIACQTSMWGINFVQPK